MPLYKVVTRILLYYSLTKKYDTYRTTHFSDSRSHLQYYMHSLHIRITVCLLELTLHYLKLSRLQITNFPLFMPTHHNILIIRLTKRTTLHCSSPANTHPTCTMLVHKAHACAETRCTPPLCLSPSLCRCVFICFRRQHVRPSADRTGSWRDSQSPSSHGFANLQVTASHTGARIVSDTIRTQHNLDVPVR